MADFNAFIEDASVVEMPTTGASFTWSNMTSSSIQCRLDRALITTSFLSAFPTCVAFAAPRLVSDHSPLHLTISTDRRIPRRLFKFYNHWVSHPDFLPLMARSWRYQLQGNPTYRFVSKLANLKRYLLPWVKQVFGVTKDRINQCTISLLTIQNALELDPSSSALLQAERNYRTQLLDLH